MKPMRLVCKNGHALIPQNVYEYLSKDGRKIRRCLKCDPLTKAGERYRKK